jgi:hypothetical protein
VDLQESPVAEPIALPDPQRYGPPTPLAASPEAVQQAAEWLVGAEHPVIVADAVGRHPDAVRTLIELAELLAIPVLDHGARFSMPWIALGLTPSSCRAPTWYWPSTWWTSCARCTGWIVTPAPCSP